MVSILIQQDQKIRKLAKNIVCMYFYAFSRSAQLIRHLSLLFPYFILELANSKFGTYTAHPFENVLPLNHSINNVLSGFNNIRQGDFVRAKAIIIHFYSKSSQFTSKTAKT